jgi:hypothetical protein
MRKETFDPTQLKVNVMLSLQMENLMLKTQLRTLREVLEYSRSEREAIESQLKALTGRSHDPEPQIAELTRLCMEMQALVAASTRLLAADTREEIFHAVQDIVANLIGSEEMALFELNAERTLLQAAAWCGISDAQKAPVTMGKGAIGEVASKGKAFFGDESQPGLAACIPLRVETEVVGVLAIFSLLPQKLQLEPGDLEVLKLLEERLGGMLLRSNTQAEEGKS